MLASQINHMIIMELFGNFYLSIIVDTCFNDDPIFLYYIDELHIYIYNVSFIYLIQF